MSVTDELDERTTVDPRARGVARPRDREARSSFASAAVAPQISAVVPPTRTSASPHLAPIDFEPPARVPAATPGPKALDAARAALFEIEADAAARAADASGAALDSAEADVVSDACFVVSAGADRGRRFPLARRRISIGRAMDNDIVLTDIAVSRKHLVIEFDGTHFVLTDLGSGNGTLVNGRDEEGTYRLLDGDTLELGNTVLSFECPGMGVVAAIAHGAAPKGWSRPSRAGDPSTVAGRRPLRVEPRDPARPPATYDAPRPAPASFAAPSPRAVPTAPANARTVHGVEVQPAAPPPRPSRPSLPPPVTIQAPLPDVAPRPLASPPGMMTTGASPYPATAYPSAPTHLPPTHLPSTHASPRSAPPHVAHMPPPSYPGGLPSYVPPPAPRFSYPGGEKTTADKRKMLFGIIGVALLAAVGGIAVALLKGDVRPRVSRAQAARTSKPATTPTTDPVQASKPVEAVARPAPTLASLSTGKRNLGFSAFGTDEGKVPSGKPTAAARAAVAAVPARDAPDPPARRVEPIEEDEEERAPKGGKPPKPKVAARDDAEEDEADDEDIVEPEPAGDKADISRDEAADLYGDLKISQAVALLRKAARQASKKEAAALLATAASYEKVADAINGADGEDPVTQLRAFKAALRADKANGDGEHQDFLRSKLAMLAPRVAGSYMAAKKYAEAKLACDDAEKFGAGKDVARIRDSLERKAEDLAAEASKLAKEGEADRAAEIAEAVLKMVPKTSAAYATAAPLVE